jgi:hypothetical protein
VTVFSVSSEVKGEKQHFAGLWWENIPPHPFLLAVLEFELRALHFARQAFYHLNHTPPALLAFF